MGKELNVKWEECVEPRQTDKRETEVVYHNRH